ncbi:hypothetical protein [Myxococcus landrumensis]|uniref:MlpB protein n=1 Tax=Myxococcus landrumensis TaxID=2813577 RepID=A0ABX7NAZ1_9BACT|nr:hypothetical protein [Myxococcus landrumus]QSQ14581.1 hypothetical protein JY572_00320 [Myxococcus landrumus]
MKATSWAVMGVMMLAGACAKREEAVQPAPAKVESPQAAAPAMHMQPTPSAPTAAMGQPGSITRVADPSLVCMVNNQLMGKPQIPVEVGGQTYYGCCEMCKERLAKDAAARTATDPVSQKSVDKAKAVIGITHDGNAIYFENEETFSTYSKQLASATK